MGKGGEGYQLQALRAETTGFMMARRRDMEVGNEG